MIIDGLLIYIPVFFLSLSLNVTHPNNPRYGDQCNQRHHYDGSVMITFAIILFILIIITIILNMLSIINNWDFVLYSCIWSVFALWQGIFNDMLL